MALTDALSAETPSTLLSLRQLEQVPADLDSPIFANYPAMKLGVPSAVDFYAARLTNLARELMHEHLEMQNWVLTAPPFNTVPAAANLLTWRMHKALRASSPDGVKLDLVDLHLEPQRMQINSDEDFKTYYQYSSNSVEQRIKERARLHQGDDDIVRNGDRFAGKNVLIVNDIKVTGTQQAFMQQSFDRVFPSRLYWLYIFEVDPQLGADQPEIEHSINSSRINSLHEFSEVLNAEDTRHTARCVSRLFSNAEDDFVNLVTQMSPATRQQILHYAQAEGRFEGDFFINKFRILKSYATQS